MKKKSLVIIFLFTSITSTYAAQGKGYHEYGETWHGAPGFNFHVEEMPTGTFDAMFKKKSK